jgi:hypothetical protein
MEVVYEMKKSLVPLALSLALVTPLANAGRMPASSDREPAPFAAHQLKPARDIAAMGGLERGSYRLLVVGAAVPGKASAQCQARLLGAGGALLEEASLEVPAGSNAQIDFANRIGLRMAVSAQVSCDQPFYGYAAAAGENEPKVVWAEDIGPNGNCDHTIDSAELITGVFVATKDGPIHQAVKGKEKGIVCINTPKDLALDRMVAEWDVTAGPWHSKLPSGNHAMLYIHRGRFRSNTVTNVNAFGPRKSFVKMNQNVDMAPSKNTNAKVGMELQNGNVYRARYTYDAANKQIKLEMIDNGVVVKTATMAATAAGRTLMVKKNGLSPKGSLFAEFGHFAGQHPPEMPSYGWRYSNLRVELHVKK